MADTSETEQQIRSYQRQLRRLASELSLAEARERREIASDLHDHIGQALAYVSQKVSRLQGNAVFSGMEEDFSEILSILRQTITYTRNLTVEISPPVLYELGLPAALDWLAERTSNRHDIQVGSSESGTFRELSEEISVFFFKAVQELVTNAVKHASATRIKIHTIWKEDGLEVSVTDNGQGFDTTSYEARLTDANCFGLFSIRERLSYLGGDITVESTPGKGVRVAMSTAYNLHPEVDND